ncbi:Hypothetical protein SRAE_2000050600 [Strongyloides ratti]|uniref:Uncharacterized protein n=1 Tax=Strongyloides ratti TaxID=34506 RepID=A0A090L7Q6_STRRB|nr:Hypothetical protein SRAE_2000050600 [Strongyloides ratti]CEF65831.1 Hypothetical protein SRAE_2000050600 [Strongyloides ratti]
MISIFLLFIFVNVFGDFNKKTNKISRDILKRIEKEIDEEKNILHVIPNYSIPREGPGENGDAVILTDEEKKLGEEELKVWFMNMQAK